MTETLAHTSAFYAAAWAFLEEHKSEATFDLVVVNPSLVYGVSQRDSAVFYAYIAYA